MKKHIPLFIAAIQFTILFPNAALSQTLNEAVIQNDTVLALKLIKSGNDPNKPDGNGSSPLMIACRWGHAPMVNFLLSNGAKPDEPRSPKGRTPLMVACSYYAGVTVVRLLTEKGANVNVTSDDGSTPLMCAAKNAKVDVIEHLLSKGADASKKDAAGKTALDYALNADIDDFVIKSIKDTRVDKNAAVALLKSATK